MFARKKLIDLTHPLDSTVPTWTGCCGFRAEVKCDYSDGCRVQKYTMHAGIGTHIDAPAHFVPHGVTVGHISLSMLFASLCVIDVSMNVRENADYQITVEDICKYEDQHGTIPPQSLVVGYTGWEKRWATPDRYRNVDEHGIMRFPSFRSEAADALLEREIVGIGIDTLSPDPADSLFPVHHKILGAGRYILENLASLHLVPARGAWGIVLPPKIDQGTEAATRVVAIVQ